VAYQHSPLNSANPHPLHFRAENLHTGYSCPEEHL